MTYVEWRTKEEEVLEDCGRSWFARLPDLPEFQSDLFVSYYRKTYYLNLCTMFRKPFALYFFAFSR